MHIVVIEAANFMQTPTQGVLLFANTYGLDMHPEHWVLRDYVGRQFEDGLTATVAQYAEKVAMNSETPGMQVVTVRSPNKSHGFELPAIVYAMADNPNQPLNGVYGVGLLEANKQKLRSLTIPLYTLGHLVNEHFVRRARSLRGALSAQTHYPGNTITQVIVAVDSPESRQLVADSLKEVFYDVV